MLRRTLAIAAVVVIAAWSLSSAQMMGMGGRQGGMMNGSGNQGYSMMGHGSMMGNGMMGYGMMNGQGMMGSGMMEGWAIRGLVNLGLSDNQIDKMIDIHADLMKEQLPLLRKQQEVWQDYASLQQQAAPDAGQYKKLMVRNAEIAGDLQANASEANGKAMKLLTDEQKAQLGDNPLPLFGGMNAMMGQGWQQNGRWMNHQGMMGNGWMGGGTPSPENPGQN